MPRVRSDAACSSCQQRKIRCDEQLPVCQNCLRAKRYCDHSRRIRFRHQHEAKLERQLNGSDESPEPRDALKDATTARLFAHYIANLGAWYDLSDGAMHFTKEIPHAAMSRPLLFYAVIAFAAVHTSATIMPSLRSVAERYHEQCIHRLLKLSSEDIESDEGYHLAAVCILRSYEILAEDFDPNRHLSGAYALSTTAPLKMDTSGLWRAGFFNYLREDITFSLMNHTALKMHLDVNMQETAVDDEDQLNIAALHLASAVNLAFGHRISADTLDRAERTFTHWCGSLPVQFTPFYDSTAVDGDAVLPTVRLPRDCHVAVAQYNLVTRSLLLQASSVAEHGGELEANAVRLCGMAFTSSSPAVLINSFGPISYCGRHVRGEALQADLIRRLYSSRKDTAWPVRRMVADLELHWRQRREQGQSGVAT